MIALVVKICDHSFCKMIHSLVVHIWWIHSIVCLITNLIVLPTLTSAWSSYCDCFPRPYPGKVKARLAVSFQEVDSFEALLSIEDSVRCLRLFRSLYARNRCSCLSCEALHRERY